MKFRKKTLLLAVQAAIGTPVVPTGATNAILTKNLEIEPLEGERLERELDKEDLGADPATMVGKHVRVRFQVEVAGAGTRGDAPAWGPAMIAAGHEQTIDTTTPGSEFVTYTPVDDALPATIYMKHDKVLHHITDARGSVTLVTGVRQYAYWQFDFIGLYNTPLDSQVSLSPDVSAFVTPVPFRAANVECTLHAETICLRELSCNLGQTNTFFECSEQETIDLEDRKASFEIKFLEPEIPTKNWFDAIDGDDIGELEYIHGTVAGNIVEFNAPNAQLTTPKRENAQGNMVLSCSGPLARVDGTEYTIKVH